MVQTFWNGGFIKYLGTTVGMGFIVTGSSLSSKEWIRWGLVSPISVFKTLIHLEVSSESERWLRIDTLDHLLLIRFKWRRVNITIYDYHNYHSSFMIIMKGLPDNIRHFL